MGLEIRFPKLKGLRRVQENEFEYIANFEVSYGFEIGLEICKYLVPLPYFLASINHFFQHAGGGHFLTNIHQQAKF